MNAIHYLKNTMTTKNIFSYICTFSDTVCIIHGVFYISKYVYYIKLLGWNAEALKPA